MSDEPKKRRSWAWICWAMIAVFCYPLSAAPVWRAAEDLGWWPTIQPVCDSVYAPVDWLFENCRPFREAMRPWSTLFDKHYEAPPGDF